MTAQDPIEGTEYRSRTTLEKHDFMGSDDVVGVVGFGDAPPENRRRIVAGPSNPTGFLEVPHGGPKTTSALEESVEASRTPGRNADGSIKVDE